MVLFIILKKHLVIPLYTITVLSAGALVKHYNYIKYEQLTIIISFLGNLL